MEELTQIEKSHYKEEYNSDIKIVLLEHEKKVVPAEWIRERTEYLCCNSEDLTGRNGG